MPRSLELASGLALVWLRSLPGAVLQQEMATESGAPVALCESKESVMLWLGVGWLIQLEVA